MGSQARAVYAVYAVYAIYGVSPAHAVYAVYYYYTRREVLEMEDWRELEVHPVAALFPMMSNDELDDLAADIKENGLVHPVILDKNDVVIDGRNRLEACWRAGVTPSFKTYEGDDPVAFILSLNVNRRHLSKGQQAMAEVRARHLAGNLVSAREAAGAIGVSKQRIVQAATVLEHAPDLADAVLAGATPLNEAYEEAKRRKIAALTREEQQARLIQQLHALQAEAPDLGALVQEERLMLDEAISALEERKRKEREYAELITRSLDSALLSLDPLGIDPDDWARDRLKADPRLVSHKADISAARARRAADVLLRYAKLREELGNA